MRILDSINGHDDLVKLNDSQMGTLCEEIRSFLVQHLSKTGGHLASNLGVVELTVAIETVFHTQKDRLVFDVGHQSYVHKLLTGRRADFDRLRQFGGIAGFPKPTESISDSFVAGHASSSISIALGMARARTLMEEDYHVIALIGDGAATGGMTYEGLNDAGGSHEPMIVILNDNEMSIDKNVGGFATHLSKLRSKGRYLGMKERYRKFMVRIPGGYPLYRASRSVKDWLKRVLLPTTVFENMGFTYLGPVNGHDLPELIALLRAAKQMRRPVLLHVITQKGRGYQPAEAHPSKFHGVGKFDPSSGDMVSKNSTTFSETFGNTMVQLARENDRVCAITAAMPGGTGLLTFKEQFPNRLFDVGIAEEHAASMAGGLAKQGMIPVLALYSTFLQRSFDQIMQDISMLKLHVVLAVDRAGLVGEDGETHHGVFDIGFLRQAPGMRILCPASCAELSDMLRWAVSCYNAPVAIRYPRGGDGLYCESAFTSETPVVTHCAGSDLAIVTYGTLINQALDAARILDEQGISVGVIRLLTVHPLPIEALSAALTQYSQVLILEEMATGSGIHQELSWQLRDRCPHLRIHSVDLGNEYVTHGSISQLYQQHGLDTVSIIKKIQEVRSVES